MRGRLVRSIVAYGLTGLVTSLVVAIGLAFAIEPGHVPDPTGRSHFGPVSSITYIVPLADGSPRPVSRDGSEQAQLPDDLLNSLLQAVQSHDLDASHPDFAIRRLFRSFGELQVRHYVSAGRDRTAIEMAWGSPHQSMEFFDYRHVVLLPERDAHQVVAVLSRHQWPDDDTRTIVIERSGWPFRCLTVEYVQERTYPAIGGIAETVEAVSGGLLIKQPKPKGTWDWTPALVLPLRPEMVGLAVNGILFAVAWWCAFSLPRRARSVVRHRRGRCPKCGYDLLGDLAAGCPECGWGRQAPGPRTAPSA